MGRRGAAIAATSPARISPSLLLRLLLPPLLPKSKLDMKRTPVDGSKPAAGTLAPPPLLLLPPPPPPLLPLLLLLLPLLLLLLGGGGATGRWTYSP